LDRLTVRLYNVRFGDGILISVPDREADGSARMRHILIDVGNAASKAGGENRVFAPAFENILEVLDGQPLDLYVMSHEHMDHVQGPLWAAKNHFSDGELTRRLDVQHLWMPASAAPDYYDSHHEAKKQLDMASAAYQGVQRSASAAVEAVPDGIAAMLRNNDRFLPARGLQLGSHARTADCVDFIRSLAPEGRRHYVHRSVGEPRNGTPPFDLSGAHPFRDAELEIWAPEEDSSEYYGRFRPVALGAAPGMAGGDAAGAIATPPPGVDAGAFYNLVAMRQGGNIENLLAIDKAANNSSIVFCLKWRGWHLLFPGDAELRSWKEMDKQNTLQPIHFLKVGHHGSHNGTPHADLLTKLFPMPDSGDRDRLAAVSTFENTYSGIPDTATFDELENDFACPMFTTLDENDGDALVLEFDG
jgi:hypothetical protein